jgi:NitT/TauT family transport system substrate-binding protein
MKKFFVPLLACAGLINLWANGGSQTQTAAAEDLNYPLKVGRSTTGGLCAAPLFIGFEKGYLEAEGIIWEEIKVDTGQANLLLTNGQLDVSSSLLASIVQPIANGLDVKISLGIHTGCQKVLVRPDSNIRTPADLKGKKIGTSGMASSGTVITQRYLAELGVGVTAENLEVEWVVFQSADLPLALERGQVDAIAVGDPTAYIIENEGKGRVIINQATDDYLKDEFCCVLLLSSDFVKNHPQLAAKYTRAIQKAAAWVQEHPDETARLMAEKRYVAGDWETNARILKTYNYKASVSEAEIAISRNVRDLQRIGLISNDIDAGGLTKNTFIALPGVPDSLYK